MEQDRKRYSTLAKSIVLVIQMVAVVMLSVSVVLLSTCVNQNMLNMGDLKNSSFVDSGYFERVFSQQMQQVMRYLQLKEKFETNGEFNNQLESVKNADTKEIEEYKKYHNKYDGQSTNLYYWLGSEETMSSSTNMEGVSSEEEAYEKGIELGRYVCYIPSVFRFETNIGGMERNYYQNMANYNSFSEGGKTLVVAVDVNFTENDDLAVAKKEFDKLYPWAKRSFVLIAVSGIVWLFCLCYMTVVAAKRSEDKEIHLYSFDRVRTEIPAGLLLVSLVFIVILALKVHQQDYQIMGQMVVSGTFTLLADICFMGLYLSLVRRVKADTFFENSFIHWFLQNIQDSLHSRYLNCRTTFTIWGVIGAELVLAYLTFARKYVWACLMLVIMTAFVLIYFSQRVIQRRKILEGIERISEGDIEYKLDPKQFQGDELLLAEGINHIGEGLAKAISESVRDERMKANMITNVSHDIKTPLTSIINYIGLLRREDIQNPNALAYIEVLEQKSMRLKQLMEDLLEVSRISSGNISLQMNDIDLVELVRQTGGEFNEKLEEKGLNVITKFPKDAVMIYADGRQLWRVIGNLYNNTAKYAMRDTRVYVEVECKDGKASFSIKNISEHLLDVNADELTERFVRGDESRSSEGSGLGLSISKMLTELMGGTFELDMDDDLFRVKVSFRCEMS